MTHKTRSEQLALGVRKDPKHKARSTRIHKVKVRDIFADQDLDEEVDEAFAEYLESEEDDE